MSNESKNKKDNDGRLTKIVDNARSITKKTGEKVGVIPDLAKDLFKASDKSEENHNEFIKQDKDLIHKIMNEKINSGDYTNEEMHEYLDKSMKLNKDSEGFIDKINKHRAAILPVVGTAVTTVLVEVIRNNKRK